MSWSIVCTTNAPARDIARFAAHHLGLSCTRIDVYLDGIEAPQLSHGKLHFHQGTQAHSAHTARQMANATACYAAAQAGWLAHVDIDEFILPLSPLEEQLAALPASAEWAKLMPIELLEPTSGPPRHYKRAPQHSGLRRGIVEELYPDYGSAMHTGFISHAEGKPVMRTGLPGAKVGIHKLRGRGKPKPARLKADLAHHHAPSWAAFAAHLERRSSGTSYTSAREGYLPIADLVRAIRAESGDEGVRRFYNTLRRASPAHLAALEAHGLLVTHDLQLTAKARKLFPGVFEAGTS